MSNVDLAHPVPAHVDAALVRDWPLKISSPISDPYEDVIPRIHAEWPEAVYALGGHSQGGNVWLFRRAEAFREIYIQSDKFSASQQTLISRLVGETWDLIPNEIDPPEHFFYRTMLNPRFSPSAIAKMSDKLRGVARQYIDKFAPLGRADLVSEFTLRFPIAIFLGLVDFPMDKVDYYLELEYELIASGKMERRSRAMHTVLQILRDVIAERRARPGDDLFSYMLNVEHRSRRMTDEELIRTGVTLYLGGLDTVAQVMGWSIRHLARNPDQQTLLRENPEKISGALEELIRAYAVSTTSRRVVEDMEFRGVRLAQGDLITMATYIAAHDPEEYENPGKVDFDRSHKRNLTFGTGAHNCIGIHLAKRELVIALEELLPRCPNFRLADGKDADWHFGPVLGLDRLELEWDI